MLRGPQEGVYNDRDERRIESKHRWQGRQQSKSYSLRDVGDTYRNPSNDVTDEHLGSVGPEPAEDGEMSEEELPPLREGVGGKEGIA